MPIQPPGKETEEMEAEGDSAAEMNGEADESEEERSGSQTESEEESSEMDDEDYERRRSECVSEMLDLEKQFSELKEKLFRERLSQLRLRLEEVGAERAPEYTEPLGGLQQSLKVRIQVAGIYKGFCLDVIRNKYECELQGAKQHLESEKLLLYDTLLGELQERIQRLEEDRQSLDISSAMCSQNPSDRSQGAASLKPKSGGTTNFIPEAARRPGTRCHPARGRKHLSFLAHTLSTCCRRSTSWKTGRPSKRPGQQCPLRREKQMAPDPVFTLRGSLEQLVPYTGLTFSAKAGGCPSYCSPLTLCQHWPGLFCCPWDRHSCGSEADLAKQDCYLQSLTSLPPPPPQCPPTKKMDFIQSGNPPDFQPYPQPLSQELGPTAGRTPKKKKKKKNSVGVLPIPAAAGDAASQSFSGLFLVSASKIPKTGIKLILIA